MIVNVDDITQTHKINFEYCLVASFHRVIMSLCRITWGRIVVAGYFLRRPRPLVPPADRRG
jgi:hypothetical protein